jgi:hypothetical protein
MNMPTDTDPLQYDSANPINPNYVPPTAPAPAAATPIQQNGTAVTQQTDADNTVQGRVEGMLTEGSKYLDSARQNAKEYSAGRGMLNTSIAATAGERAAIESAAPIASADAQIINTQELANQQAENTLVGQTNQADLNSQLGDQELSRQLQAAEYQTQLGEFASESNNQRQEELMNLESALKERLAALQQDYAVDLETIKSNFDLQGNLDNTMGAFYSDALKSLASFLNSPDLTAEQQSSGAKTIIGNLQAGLNFLTGLNSTPTTVDYGA